MPRKKVLNHQTSQYSAAGQEAFASLTDERKDELVSAVRAIAHEYEEVMEDAARSAEDDAVDGIEALYQEYGADAILFAVDKHGRADNYTHQCESLSEIVLYRMN